MVDENDKMEIEYLFFDRMMKLIEIEKHFNGKYSYQDLDFATKKMIGEYNGVAVETIKQTISRNEN